MNRPAPHGADAHAGAARPVLFVLGGIVSVQFGAALAKGLFAGLRPAGTVFVRVAAAALVLLAFARPVRARPSRRSLLLVVGFGLVLAAMNLSFYLALDRAPLGAVVTIEFLGPLSVAVAGSRRRLDGVWVLLAAGGVLLLTGGGGLLGGGPAIDGWGVALALVAGACWAAYILLAQRVGAAVPGTSGLALAMAVGAVALVAPGVAQGGSGLLDPGLLAGGAAVGVLSSALPYTLELVALRSLRASTFGVLMSLEPAVAACAGWALLHERLTPLQVLAIGAVCAASAGALRTAGGPRDA